MMSLAEIKKLISCIDLTDLSDKTNIKELCQKAITPLGPVAAICVYPQYVSQIKIPLKIATVVNFPKGNDSLEKITSTIKQAILDGASEIDMVIPKSNPAEIIRECKKICGDKILLKIILETGNLSPLQIKEYTELAIENGADFIKTSTGKTSIGATPEAAKIILDTIAHSKKSIGFKASGGIKTFEQAKIYCDLVKEINPTNFRIGASSLLEELLSCISQNLN